MITLDIDEQVAIAHGGYERAVRYLPQWEGKTKKRNYQHDREQLTFVEFVAQQTEALGAEVAVAKYFKRPFSITNLNYKDLADVGNNIEVKWTRWRQGSLILTALDRKEDIAILVTGMMPVYFITGWIPVAMARRHQQMRSDGTWWISQADLQPMLHFHRSIYGQNLQP